MRGCYSVCAVARGELCGHRVALSLCTGRCTQPARGIPSVLRSVRLLLLSGLCAPIGSDSNTRLVGGQEGWGQEGWGEEA